MPGFQQAPVLQFFGALNAELDTLVLKAGAAVSSLASVGTAAAAAEAEHRGSMERIAGQADETSARVSATSSAIAESVARAEGAVSSGSAAIGAHASEAQAQVDRMTEGVAAGLGRQATALDSVLAGLDFADLALDHYTESFLSALEASKAGILDLDEVVRVFGDFILVIDGKATTVRETFTRLNLREWILEFQELTRQVQTGAADLSAVEELLARSQNSVAQKLLEVIRLFKAGEVSLAAVQRVVADIERVFRDSDLDNLAQAILGGLRDGTL